MVRSFSQFSCYLGKSKKQSWISGVDIFTRISTQGGGYCTGYYTLYMYFMFPFWENFPIEAQYNKSWKFYHQMAFQKLINQENPSTEWHELLPLLLKLEISNNLFSWLSETIVARWEIRCEKCEESFPSQKRASTHTRLVHVKYCISSQGYPPGMICSVQKKIWHFTKCKIKPTLKPMVQQYALKPKASIRLYLLKNSLNELSGLQSTRICTFVGLF